MEISGDFGPLRRQLATFNRTGGGISIQVKADVDQASFARAKAKGGTLGGTEEVKLKADIDMSSFARAKAGMAVLTKESNKLSDVFNRSNLSIGQWTGILAAASPIILDVAGALGALTASLGAATAGLGALGVGLGGIATVGFGGIAAIAAPAIKSLGDLMTAQTSLNKARSTGAGAAARSAASSTQQITAAETALANAQRSEKIAQDSLNLAREEAIRQLEDMKRAALESGTSEKRARLSLRQAEQNLRDLRKQQGVSALDIRDAELSIVEARQNVKDVSIQAQRSQEDYNKAQRDGVSKMPQVVSAQRSYDDAVRATAQANQALAQAQKESNAAAGAGATQLAALRLAQKKAGPEAVKFAKDLKAMGQRWRELTKAGKTDFFGILNDGLGRLNKRLPLFAKSANTSMDALRKGLDAFWKKATDGPEFTKFIKVMTRTFANSMVPLGDAFGNVAKVLERISVAVAPDLVRMFKGFDEMTQGWVDSTRNAGDLRDTVHELVNQAHAWKDLIVAAADLIVSALVPGMGQGKQAVEGITDQLKEWTRWVDAHPKEMRDFFKEALKTTGQLADALLSFLPTFFQISTAMRPLSRAFLGILKGLNSLKVGNVSALTVLLGVMVGAKLIRGLTGLIGTFGRLRTAALGAATAERAAATVPLGAGTKATTVTGRTIGSTGTVAAGGRFGRTKAIARGIGAAAIGTAVISGIFDAFDDKGLQRSFGMKLQDFFHGATFGLVQGSAEAAQEASQAIADVISRIRPGGVIPDDAATTAVAAGKIKGLTDATLALVRVRSQLLPQLVREGSLTQDQADALAAYTKQQQKVLANAKDFTTGRRKGLGFAEALAEDKKLIGPEVADILGKLGKLSPGARTEAANTMIGMAKVLEQKGQLPKGAAKDLRDAVVQTYHGMKVKSVEESGKMAKGVAINAAALVDAVSFGMGLLRGNVNDALRQLGVKAAKFITSKDAPKKAGSALGTFIGRVTAGQKGAMIVPGHGSGDKVPVRAMVESGEVLAVLNRNAAKAWMKWNEKFPRFAKGGIVGLGKSLQRQGYEVGEHPAFGGVAPRPTHVDNSLHYSGRAIDINDDLPPFASGSGEPGSLDRLYAKLKGTAGIVELLWRVANHFDHLHIGVAPGFKFHGVGGGDAAVTKLARILLKGPKGALTDMGQGALDMTRKAAQDFLDKQAPAGGGDLVNVGGVATGPVQQMAKAMVKQIWGMGQWPPFVSLEMSEAGWNPHADNPTSTAYGIAQNINPSTYPPAGRPGSSAPILEQAKAQLQWMVQYIKGRYGTPAAAWAFHQGNNYYKQGGIAAPYVGKFHDGGFVGQDGLGLLQRGEMVLPGLQKGGSVAPSIPRDLIRALRHLVHFTPEDSRKERRQEARLLRRIARTDGVKQLNLISKALGKYGVDFTKAEEKRLRKLSRDQAHGGGLTDEQHSELRDLRRESRQAGGQKDIREQIAVQREMIAQFKEYQRDAKERNRMLREIRAAGNQPMKAVSNWIASDIGFSQRQKARQASAGNVARY